MIKKEVGGGVAWANKADYEYEGKNFEADLKIGDKVSILDAGQEEQGDYGMRKVFKVETRNGEKKVAFNQKTINVLVDAFGDDSDKWVGKEVDVLLNKTVIAGKKVIVCYLVTEGWVLDDFGDLVRPEGVDNTNDSVDGIDTAEYPEAEAKN